MTIRAKIPTITRARVAYSVRAKRLPQNLPPRIAQIIDYLAKHPASPAALVCEALDITRNAFAGFTHVADSMKLIKRVNLDGPPNLIRESRHVSSTHALPVAADRKRTRKPRA